MNLLPETEKKLIKKGLNLRFLIVFSLLVALALLVGIVSLVPAFVLAKAKLMETTLLAQAENHSRTIETEKILAVPEEIKSKTEIFLKSIPKFRVAEIFYLIAKDLPAGVVVKSVSFAGQSAGQTPREVRVSGVSGDRQSLIAFSDKLRAESLFVGVEVPVSSLTREKNLPFSIKIKLSE